MKKLIPITSQQIDQPFVFPPIRSERAREVARHFEVEDRTSNPVTNTNALDDTSLELMLPRPGEITLITGASGSGKSSLLRTLCEQLNPTDLIDLTQIPLREVPIVDLFPSLDLPETLALLSKVGIAEAWSYLRLPAELSDGQRWRLKIALAMQQAKQSPASILICDEFATVLDRVTARIISHRLGRWIHQQSLRAIFVCAQDDLSKPLNPAIQIRCDFSRIRIARKTGHTAQTGAAR